MITVQYNYGKKNNLPIITALPLGSIAKYWPGTILRHPDLPNVS